MWQTCAQRGLLSGRGSQQVRGRNPRLTAQLSSLRHNLMPADVGSGAMQLGSESAAKKHAVAVAQGPRSLAAGQQICRRNRQGGQSSSRQAAGRQAGQARSACRGTGCSASPDVRHEARGVGGRKAPRGLVVVTAGAPQAGEAWQGEEALAQTGSSKLWGTGKRVRLCRLSGTHVCTH